MNGLDLIVAFLLGWGVVSLLCLLLWVAALEIAGYFAQRREPRPGYLYERDRERVGL